MSIESKIEALTAAVNRLVDVLQTREAQPESKPKKAEKKETVVPATPVVLTYTEQDSQTAAQVVVALDNAMPAPPSFETPAPAAPTPVKSGAPFTDGKGLVEYVMDVYRTLGAERGAKIQDVIVGLGYANVNEIKPEHFDAFFTGVEALK
jgi:hypothetical protein